MEPVDLASSRFVLRAGDGATAVVTADPATGRSDFVTLHTDPLRRGILVLSWTVTSAACHVPGGS